MELLERIFQTYELRRKTKKRKRAGTYAFQRFSKPFVLLRESLYVNTH